MPSPEEEREKKESVLSEVAEGGLEIVDGILDIGGSIAEAAGGVVEAAGGAAGEALSGCAGCAPVVLLAFFLPVGLTIGHFIF